MIAGNFSPNISSGGHQGFTIVELLISMVISLIILGAGVAAFSGALQTRDFESSRTDAINSAQAAINIMSREIGNSGFGIGDSASGAKNNGLILVDCGLKRLHFRANVNNRDMTTAAPGEDITYYYDADSESIVRYDAFTGVRSGIINRVSDVDFDYWNYAFGTAPTNSNVATTSTGRVTIKLTVRIADVQGKPSNHTVTIRSDVALRNSPLLLSQY